jgi:hypothetical protein
VKLYERLPRHVEVNGRRHRVDLDFRNVLRMMDILADKGLTDRAREVLAGRCVSKHPCRGLVDAVRELIKGNETKAVEDHKRVTSFEQDAGLIRAAFQQAYGIDLWRVKMHWFQFIELLQNLPEDTQYMTIVGIRARPMPKPTKYNRDEREWLRKAKAQYALTESEEDREKSYQREVKQVFAGLMAMAQKG